MLRFEVFVVSLEWQFCGGGYPLLNMTVFLFFFVGDLVWVFGVDVLEEEGLRGGFWRRVSLWDGLLWGAWSSFRFFFIIQGRNYLLSQSYFSPAHFVSGFFRFGCFSHFRGSGFWRFFFCCWWDLLQFWRQAQARCPGCLQYPWCNGYRRRKWTQRH